ncbi:MAG: hypothetical protein GY810_11690 [Aureispira sp.]|nr:hypothetical protein [Aureispira sp.]
MNKSRLIQLFSTLTKPELRKFRQWLASPCHNQRAEVELLYDYLTNDITGFQEEYLDKKVAWRLLFKNQAYDNTKFLHLMHQLLRQLEEFISYERFRASPLLEELYLLQELKERRLPKYFNNILKKTTKQQKQQGLENALYWQRAYEFKMEVFQFSELEKRATNVDLKELSDALDISYYIQKLSLACSILSHQTVQQQKDYDTKRLERVLQEVEEDSLLDIPAVAMYYYAYKAMTHSDGEEFFQKYLSLLKISTALFESIELRDFYLMGINYCIRQLNKGSKLHLEAVFYLYKEGVEQQYLLLNGELSPWTYQNIVASGIRLEHYEWVEQFVDTYKTQLPDQYKDILYRLCLGKLRHAQGQLLEAIELLQKLDSKDIFLHINAKILLAKVYYEVDEFDLLDMLLTSIKAYMRRKRVIGYHKENYLNTIQCIQQLTELNLLDKTIKTQFVSTVEALKPLTEKVWILRMLE